MVKALIGCTDDAVQDDWRRCFDELLPEVVPFEGAGDLLRDVHRRGVTIVLATSSPEDLLRKLRVKIDADEAIDDAVTSADVEEAKPQPDIFEVARARSCVQREDERVVGDSRWDVAAAAKAQLRCIAVESGGSEAGAHAVYRDPHQLCMWLDDWLE